VQKHSVLHQIAHELGAPKTSPYPDDRYDIVWTLRGNKIVKKESEQCPGIDRPYKKGRKDPDLEIPLRLNANEGDELDLEEYEYEGGADADDEDTYLSSFLPSQGQLRLAGLD
jgi:hypothetical protein